MEKYTQCFQNVECHAIEIRTRRDRDGYGIGYQFILIHINRLPVESDTAYTFFENIRLLIVLRQN